MIKLKQFNTVEGEAAAFGDLDKVDLYYDYYPDQYGGRRGSMASFGFRLLIAELPLHLGKPLDAMDRLYSLLAKVEQLLSKGTLYRKPKSAFLMRRCRMIKSSNFRSRCQRVKFMERAKNSSSVCLSQLWYTAKRFRIGFHNT